ncbi:MAG: ADP-ribosylglycohydrolase family protein [Clostridiales bacterium]|nr:ADP-ribosylglycohydrolase family protein [Clostridiales bacterium]
MIGVAVGDIAGSRFEFSDCGTKDFELFNEECDFTDDTIMAVAVAEAIMNCGIKAPEEELHDAFIFSMRKYGKEYPHPTGGYGASFTRWLRIEDPKPYGSYGNGSAMRVAACGYAADSLSTAEKLARCSAEVTHNHPEGIKGAVCVAACIYLAKTGSSKEQIKSVVENRFYPLKENVEEIRKHYSFNESCQGTVPQAIQAFLESKNFEDAIRNAVYLGGDSDTLGAITGGIAEAYYGVPENIKKKARSYLTKDMLEVIDKFEKEYRKI